jgi:hypothetical protein
VRPKRQPLGYVPAVRRLLKLVVLGAIVAAVVSAVRRQRAPEPAPWPPAEPWPKADTEVPAPPAAWLEPTASGTCPEAYPVKAKTASGIFHVPGGASYDRTTPDRCYRSAEAAEADGLRQAKR